MVPKLILLVTGRGLSVLCPWIGISHKESNSSPTKIWAFRVSSILASVGVQSHLCSECSHRGWIEGLSIKISLLRGPDRFAGPHLAFIMAGSLLQYKSIKVSFPKNLTELTMIEATSQNHLISNFFNHGRPPNYSAARSKFFFTTGKYFRYLKLTGCGRWTYLCGADV